MAGLSFTPCLQGPAGRDDPSPCPLSLGGWGPSQALGGGACTPQFVCEVRRLPLCAWLCTSRWRHRYCVCSALGFSVETAYNYDGCDGGFVESLVGSSWSDVIPVSSHHFTTILITMGQGQI